MTKINKVIIDNIPIDPLQLLGIKDYNLSLWMLIPTQTIKNVGRLQIRKIKYYNKRLGTS